jgi:catechol 2,3-dioxygenase-like lactoylglutathione lyase family enzyme
MVELNHTIVKARDRVAAAKFVAEILGLAEPVPYGPFMTVALAHDLTLDYQQEDGAIPAQHLAFKVTEAEFDEIFGRIKDRGVAHWADPFHRQPGEINTNDGGRGVYFTDPDGHNLEIITRSYGSGSA